MLSGYKNSIDYEILAVNAVNCYLNKLIYNVILINRKYGR